MYIYIYRLRKRQKFILWDVNVAMATKTREITQT